MRCWPPALLTLLLLPACRQGPGALAGRQGCSWMSEDEVSQLFGRTMRQTRSDPDGCTLESESDDLLLAYDVRPDEGEFASLSGYVGPEEVKGLGEAARWVSMQGGTTAQIHVLKNGQFFIATLDAGNRPMPDLRVRAEAFARAMAERM